MPRRKPMEERPVDELSGYFAERRCGRCGVLAIDYEVVCALCQQEPVRAWAIQCADGLLMGVKSLHMPILWPAASMAASGACLEEGEHVVEVEIRVVPAPSEAGVDDDE